MAGNDGSYGGCNPDCTLAGVCSDGVVQPLDEVCDDGVNDGAYGGCSADCQMRSPYCGDGTEECDDANGNDSDGCTRTCEAPIL